METQYIVQGFETGKRGKVVAMPAVAYKTAEEACRRAERLAETCLGVIAFEQSADPEAGEWGDPVVLLSIGDVPEL
ncbi:hypothetical protein EC912_10548 [Luteibacter rhizovicinus]|uniref:Uncharacterized protein n=1 Tax=Luteibacter rhizovicinus TaxID=242606 RepID=A0A4R3YNS8_9GAMM|nr:hypothetical protein [Luteibacter rhizovicinus]TCV93188.1 hypothetical protein EC912_10548 [Luteibacter rhizovicinus]